MKENTDYRLLGGPFDGNIVELTEHIDSVDFLSIDKYVDGVKQELPEVYHKRSFTISLSIGGSVFRCICFVHSSLADNPTSLSSEANYATKAIMSNSRRLIEDIFRGKSQEIGFMQPSFAGTLSVEA